MRKRIKHLSIIFFAITNFSCQENESPAEIVDPTQEISCNLIPADPNHLINGDQLPIVAGKLLSYAVVKKRNVLIHRRGNGSICMEWFIIDI